MNIAGMGIDLDDVADLNTLVGTTGALGMTGLGADPVFEFTVQLVALTTGIAGD